MAETPIQRFKRLLPQFAGESDETINLWLGDGAKVVCRKAFGCRWQDAVIYYAGHLWTLANLNAAIATGGPGAIFGFAGVASSVKEGDLSVSLKTGSGNALSQSFSDDALASTIPGRQFLQIRDETVVGLRWYSPEHHPSH